MSTDATVAPNHPYYLLIDSSTDTCSVALINKDGHIIDEASNPERNRHAEMLPVLCQTLLANLPHDGKLAGVGVSEGPGSYTGLRIGAAYVKGLCWALQIPLVAIPTTELLTLSYLESVQPKDDSAIYMPMIDARRMEVYTGLYTASLQSLSPILALILTQEDEIKQLSTFAASDPHIVYFGSGAEKAIDTMNTHFPNSVYGGNLPPKASAMASLVIHKIAMGDVVDIAYWEPFYLKEYQAKISANRVLGNVKTE